MNKKQLQEQVERLEAENADFQTDIDELETKNWDLEDELLELRGFVPYFPPASAANEPQEYIRLFNQNRHLKEIGA